LVTFRIHQFFCLHDEMVNSTRTEKQTLHGLERATAGREAKLLPHPSLLQAV
jgi:hypothetical protein